MDNNMLNQVKSELLKEVKMPRYKDEIHFMQELLLAPYATHKPKENSRKNSLESISNKETRSEFQRDRDRIIHSNAFRRLMYKTQVFVNHEGDYFRTRMTHSLEVAQIARGIARSLGVNEDLTEAIALGHDLGHTPFGHAVEEFLNDILKHEHGFLHNIHSVRVVDVIEQKSGTENYGLNLTWEVREGILKHNSDREEGIYNELSPNEPASLEGQIVELVDTVAYVCHDLDDGIKAGLINEKIREGLLEDKCLRTIYESFDRKESDEIGSIINALVCDIADSSWNIIRDHNIDSLEKVRSFTDNKNKNRIIRLNKYSEQFRALKRFVSENIYQSPMTTIMDVKAKKFVAEIYNSYWNNPKQLPDKIYKLFISATDSSVKNEKSPYDGYANTPQRALCDYIAAMTDRTALETYDKLFGPFTRI